jgi:hypothetical protein
LFVPGRVKIPLEFAAATAMAVLIFSILYIQGPEKMIPGVPESTTPVKTTEKAPMDMDSSSVKGAAFKSKPVLGKTTAPPPAKKQEIIELTLLLKEERSGEEQPSSESLKPGPARQRDAERPRTARLAAPKAQVEKDMLKRERQVTGLSKEKSPVIEEESRSSFSSLQDTFVKVKELILLAEGKTLSVEYGPHSDQLKSIRAEIPARNYKSFCDKISRLAVLQPFPPPPSESDVRTIQIRIRFKSS